MAAKSRGITEICADCKLPISDAICHSKYSCSRDPYTFSFPNFSRSSLLNVPLLQRHPRRYIYQDANAHFITSSSPQMELEEGILSDKTELAVLYFKQRNYEQSLRLFSEVLLRMASLTPSQIGAIRKSYNLRDRPLIGKVAHPRMTAVLDQRAATYEKLGRPQLAWRDAQRIVDLDPANCKGYLRQGKLLLAENKRIEAYKTYQRGIFVITEAVRQKKTEVSPKLLLQLQSQYNELNRRLKEERNSTKASKSMSLPGIQGRLDEMLPLKRAASLPHPSNLKKHKAMIDPFLILPPELIENIFAFTPFSAVLRGHLVCHSWYKTLTSIPRLYYDGFQLKHRISVAEYLKGVQLMKKIMKNLAQNSIRFLSLWSTYNLKNLERILESIVFDPLLKLKRLHLVNSDLALELLFKILIKFPTRSTGLNSVEHLKLGINSSVIFESMLLKICPNVKHLEIIIVDQKMLGASVKMLPTHWEHFRNLMDEAKQISGLACLERLYVTNHPQLRRDLRSSRPSRTTFDPAPPFLLMQFHNLRELKITSYDFSSQLDQFTKLLGHAKMLQEIYLEDNDSLTLQEFLQMLVQVKPAFMLQRLTMREICTTGAYHLDRTNLDDLKCLSALRNLDIYGSSISGTGLLQMLRIANVEGNLVSLNCGHSSNLQFRCDKFITGGFVLDFIDILRLAPGIKELHLPELDLDSLSLKCLFRDIESILRPAPCFLKSLDLSFCSKVDGIALMNLFNTSATEVEGRSKLFVENLIIDGLTLSESTAQLLLRRKYVGVLQNDALKKKWRQYNVNSHILEVSRASS